MNKSIKLIAGLGCAAVAVLLSACADDGFDDKERFTGGVSGTQLQSPVIDASSFSVLTNPDGTESVKLTWPVVVGAAGYKANVSVVDDPANPEALITDSIIDGCSLVFERREETKYRVTVQTLGRADLNNSDAAAPTEAFYSSYLPASVIPAGQELSQYIAANLPAPGEEVAFELEAGRTYTLDGTVDFGLTQVYFRGDKVNRPTVKMGPSGCFTTKAGLKIKYINFDCADLDETMSIVRMGAEGDPSIRANALGYDGANAEKVFVIEKPVIIESCWFKDLSRGILTWDYNCAWVLKDLRVTDCIFQLHYGESRGDKALLGLAGTWTSDATNQGYIFGLTVKNNTFYNTETNGKSYFIRYSNASNAQPDKTLGAAYKDASTHVWTSNTFVRTFTGKDFGNNIQNGVKIYFDDNIFFDTFRINKYTRGKNYFGTNVTAADEGRTPDSGDVNGTDSNGNPRCILDEQLSFDYMQEMDFTKPNAGVNFKSNSSLVTGNRLGDPRWLD